jgi:hypothetical protein
MGVQLGSLDDSDDPILITTAVFNRPVVAGHVDLQRREDLELWSALHALAHLGAGLHPLGVLTNDDPYQRPDRTLVWRDRTWGTELTQLTVTNVSPAATPTPRQEMAQAARFRDRLQQRIESEPTAYAHLVGRAVSIQKFPTKVLPKRDGPLLDQIAEALKQDKGVLTVDKAAGAISQGMYGSYGPMGVTAHAAPGIAGFSIHVSCNFSIRRSEAIAAYAERIAVKDEPGNDIVVVTCGVPDKHGWASASDHALFLHLQSAIRSGIRLLPTKPTHIHGVIIHQSPNDLELILAHESGDVPWRSSPPGSEAYSDAPPGAAPATQSPESSPRGTRPPRPTGGR